MPVDGALAPGGQVDLFMQFPFGQVPTLLRVQRGRAQYQPADLSTQCQYRCQVPAIADPDHRDRVGIHVALAHEPIVGRTQVREVLLPVDGAALLLPAFMPPQVEGQAHRAQAGDLARATEVVRLASPPAVDEQHARDALGRRQHGAVQPLPALDGNLDGFQAYGHAGSSIRLYLHTMPATPSSPR